MLGSVGRESEENDDGPVDCSDELYVHYDLSN